MPSPTGKRLLPLGLHPGSCAVAPALSHLAHSTSAKRARSPFERRRAPERVMYPEKREPQPKVAVLVIDGGKWTVPTLPDTDRLHSGSLESLALAIPGTIEFRCDIPAAIVAASRRGRRRCGEHVFFVGASEVHDLARASDGWSGHSISSFEQSPACSTPACTVSQRVHSVPAVLSVELVAVAPLYFERKGRLGQQHPRAPPLVLRRPVLLDSLQAAFQCTLPGAW